MKYILLVFTLILSSHAISGEVNVNKLHKIDWITLTSESFSVTTDSNEKQAKKVLEQLERFRFFMSLLLGIEQNKLQVKVPVILAQRNSTYRALGIVSSYSGVTVCEGNDMVIFAKATGFVKTGAGKTNKGRKAVLHSLTNLFFRNSIVGFATPPWFRVGMAEYLSTYTETKKQVTVGDTRLMKNRFYSLLKPKAGGFVNVDIESLMKVEALRSREDSSWDERKDEGKFFARSLALVHYLNSDPVRRKKLYQYLFLIKKNYSIDESFQAVFEMEFSDLDKEVNAYIRGKYMLARVFDLKRNAIKFPKLAYTVLHPEKQEALNLITSNIALFSDNLLNEKDRKKMFAEVEALYPDISESDKAP